MRLNYVNYNRTRNGSNSLGNFCPNAQNCPSNYQFEEETAVPSTVIAMLSCSTSVNEHQGHTGAPLYKRWADLQGFTD